MLHTTFKLLHQAGACSDRYKVLARALGGVKKYGTTTPIPLDRVLETNGLDDTLWALRAVLIEEGAERDKLSRLLAADYAEEVLPLYEERYPNDLRPRQTIEAARAYALGKISRYDLEAAWEVAWEVAWTVAWEVAWEVTREKQASQLLAYLKGGLDDQ